MISLRSATMLVLTLLSASALALPDFWEVFERHYRPAAGTTIAEGKCITCHVAENSTRRNPFGESVEAQVAGSSELALTVAMLEAIESEDADGDGRSNLSEISDGSLPGKADGVEAVPAPSGMVPTHSFHPLFVHFPLGIYLFGAGLAFAGALKGNDDWKRLSRIALGTGTAVYLFAVLSGVAAMLRMQIPLEGTMLIHLILGLSGGFLALTVVALKRQTAGYWVLLAMSAIVIAATGHFGSTMVWG